MQPTQRLFPLALACLMTACGSSGTGDNTSAQPPHPLNDTGTSFCRAPDGVTTDCASAPEQDGNTGRDVNAAQQGGGYLGLDLTKLDASGEPLARQDLPWNPNGSPNASDQWHCVRDNHTGLVWEVKSTTEGALNHKDWSYQWHQADPLTNGGFAGAASSNACGPVTCDSQAFVAAMNEKRWCGSNQWRLPTAGEGLSLVVTDHLNLAFDTHYFPHAQPSHYWTSQSYAPDATKAWYLYLSDGSIASTLKDKPMYLRLVYSPAEEAQ